MHVPTADYYNTQAPSVLAPYLTYEYPPHSDAATYASFHDAGIKTIRYEDPFTPLSGEYEQTLLLGADVAAQAKACDGTPTLFNGGKGDFADLHSPIIAAYLQAVLDHYATSQPDVAFFDNANDFYTVTPLPCSYASAADWTSALTATLGQLHGPPLLLNTLSVPENYATAPSGVTPQNQVNGLAASTVLGGEFESCYVNNPAAWSATETTEILTGQAHKMFACYANGAWSSHAADQWTAQRLFVYASYLLTYNPNSFFQTWLQTPSGFKVMPETQLVPTAPVYGISKISDTLYGSGAYARSYRACYYAGQLVSACEVVVNPSTTATVTSIPNASAYTASMVLHGSDVLDGGSVTFDGPVPASLAPQSAAILVKP